MVICNPRTLVFALLIAALPMTVAVAGGRGGGGGVIGAGVGAAGMGSAAVGGGAAAVGGGPPAGAVGGGSPGSNNPAGNGAAGTGNPSRNAVGLSEGSSNASPGITNATSAGGYIGGAGIAAAPEPVGGISPSVLTQQPASGQGATPPKALEGMAELQTQLSTTGLAVPGPDGVSTVTVAPRPCGVAAHGTDGTTTCVGISRRTR
jgi:hypothetical protein